MLQRARLRKELKKAQDDNTKANEKLLEWEEKRVNFSANKKWKLYEMDEWMYCMCIDAGWFAWQGQEVRVENVWVAPHVDMEDPGGRNFI